MTSPRRTLRTVVTSPSPAELAWRRRSLPVSNGWPPTWEWLPALRGKNHENHPTRCFFSGRVPDRHSFSLRPVSHGLPGGPIFFFDFWIWGPPGNPPGLENLGGAGKKSVTLSLIKNG